MPRRSCSSARRMRRWFSVRNVPAPTSSRLPRLLFDQPRATCGRTGFSPWSSGRRRRSRGLGFGGRRCSSWRKRSSAEGTSARSSVRRARRAPMLSSSRTDARTSSIATSSAAPSAACFSCRSPPRRASARSRGSASTTSASSWRHQTATARTGRPSTAARLHSSSATSAAASASRGSARRTRQSRSR
jgi:hypothetical protein